MTLLHKTAVSILMAVGIAFPATSARQEGAALTAAIPRPGVPDTEAQKQGEALFWKDCSLCHVDRSSPRYNHRGRKTLGIVASSDLVGLYKRPTTTDARVRQIIEEGISGRMPAFKHTYVLKPGAVDQLVEYLRIR